MTEFPTRKNVRVKWHDYNGGAYFITVCTQNMHHYFGEIAGITITYTPLGKCLHDILADYNKFHPNVEIPLFTVMPNHFHAVLLISNGIDPYSQEYDNLKDGRSLATHVATIKALVTRFARRAEDSFKWQRGFHEHIIRDMNKANAIFEYIENNVLRWAADKYNK